MLNFYVYNELEFVDTFCPLLVHIVHNQVIGIYVTLCKILKHLGREQPRDRTTCNALKSQIQKKMVHNLEYNTN